MLCCQNRVGLTHEQALYMLIKRMVQANVKRSKHQTAVKNVMLISTKAVSSNMIPVVNWKGNRLCDIFAMKVALSDLDFVFRVFLLISYVF